VLRAIHVSDGPALRDTPEHYARETWPGRTACAIRRVAPDIDLECWFMARGGEGRAFEQDGVRFRIFPSVAARGGLRWSAEMVRALRADAREGALLHAHGYPTRMFRAMAKVDAPLVAQDHGRDPHNYRARSALHAVYQRARRLLDERPLPRVDQFYVLTPEEGERVARFVGAERVRFQPMGIDVERFRPGDPHAARAALGLPGEGRLLLYVGNDMLRKGADLAIEALPQVNDATLALVGRPGDAVLSRLAARARELGVEARVRFLGHVDDALLPEAYRAADLFVLPTRAEGTLVTVSVMEAVARALREGVSRSFPPSRAFAAGRFGWGPIAEATARDYRRLASSR
jgi:glycosyltransferase involved in cell wall biosynthesis